MAHKQQKHPWDALNSPAALLVNALFRSRNHIWGNDQQIVAKHGLTWSQFSVLLNLHAQFPECTMSPTEMYSAAQVTSGGLTKMLNSMETDDLIVRVDDPNDGRSRHVKLTRRGRKRIEAIVDELVETNTALLNTILEKGETKQLVKLLQKLSRGLDAMQ